MHRHVLGIHGGNPPRTHSQTSLAQIPKRGIRLRLIGRRDGSSPSISVDTALHYDACG